jgi:hypothetical protein
VQGPARSGKAFAVSQGPSLPPTGSERRPRWLLPRFGTESRWVAAAGVAREGSGSEAVCVKGKEHCVLIQGCVRRLVTSSAVTMAGKAAAGCLTLWVSGRLKGGEAGLMAFKTGGASRVTMS